MEGLKGRIKLTDLVPFIIFLLILIVFSIATQGRLISASNLTNIVNQSIPAIIAGLGMIFVISMGGTDISHGSLLALSATLSAYATAALGPIVTFPVAMLVGACSGLLVGVINSKCKVPSFMITLSLTISLRALVGLLLGSQTFQMAKEVRVLIDGWPFKMSALCVLVGVVGYLFNYTRFGIYAKAIGENESAVRYSGVNVDRIKIMAFMLSGIMAAVAGVFAVARVGGVNNTIGSSFEMRVMMALFIGGVPVQGGVGSKIYKLILGAPMIAMLESGLVLCGISGSITQGVRGAVLLGAVLLTRIMHERFSSMAASKREQEESMTKFEGRSSHV